MPDYVTKVQVHAAADVVDRNGKKPAPDSVRAEIGYGSNSTMAMHLKTWVPRDQRLALPPVPEALDAAVHSLTGDLWSIALTDASDQFKVKLANAVAETIEAQTAAAALAGQMDQFAAEILEMRQTIQKLEGTIEERDRQIIEYRDFTDHQIIEDAKKEGEIKALRQSMAEFSEFIKASTTAGSEDSVSA
jgi:hypothetical protein